MKPAMNAVKINVYCAILRIVNGFNSGLGFQGVTWVISLLSAIISQAAVGAPRSIALMSEFISCCSSPAAPEDPPFCNIFDEDWRNVS